MCRLPLVHSLMVRRGGCVVWLPVAMASGCCGRKAAARAHKAQNSAGRLPMSYSNKGRARFWQKFIERLVTQSTGVSDAS